MGYPTTTSRSRGSIFWAAVIMFIGPLVFAFLPIISHFIFGLIGGKVAGSPGRGVTAALLPTLLGIAVLVLFSLLSLHPFIGLFGGLGLFFIGLFASLVVIVGAFIGGLL